MNFLARGVIVGLQLLWLQGAAAAAPAAEPPADRILVMIPIAPPHYRPGIAYGGGYDDALGADARQRVARDLAEAQHLAQLGRWPMPALAVECFLMGLSEDQVAAPVLQAIARDPRVAWAQPVSTYRTLGHNDPLFELQPAARPWHLAEVHAFTTGRDVSVAVIDSAIEVRHPDLQGRVALARNFVDGDDGHPESHGTAVAGVIAANADNGLGMVGIAPQARLLALRACWEIDSVTTRCDSFTLAKALQFALEHRPQVVNLSLTGPRDALLAALIDRALALGITVVCAIDPAQAGGGFPAERAGVLAVDAEESGGAAAIRAPGRAVPATLPGGRWGFVEGSSFAAAQIAGAVALLKQILPDAGPEETRARLAAAPRLARTADGAAAPPAPATDLCAVLAGAARICACHCGADGAATAGADLSMAARR